MQVRRYTFADSARASLAGRALGEAGVAVDGPYRRSPSDEAEEVFAYVEQGQDGDVRRALASYPADDVTVEDLDPSGPTASSVRRRSASGTALHDVLGAEQNGVQVTLADGAVVAVGEGRSFEVRPTENLHVYRGQLRVAVFRAGSWQYAERTFAPPPASTPVQDGGHRSRDHVADEPGTDRTALRALAEERYRARQRELRSLTLEELKARIDENAISLEAMRLESQGSLDGPGPPRDVEAAPGSAQD